MISFKWKLLLLFTRDDPIFFPIQIHNSCDLEPKENYIDAETVWQNTFSVAGLGPAVLSLRVVFVKLAKK